MSPLYLESACAVGRGLRQEHDAVSWARTLGPGLASVFALSLGAGAALVGPPAHADEPMSAEIIAVQIRDQGYACEDPVSAVRDRQLSRPDEADWVLHCKNATYRVRLIPDMAADVKRLD